MFTLTTGSPGTGKTLSAMESLLSLVPKKPTPLVEKLLKLLGGVPASPDSPRKIFVHGIQELAIPHTLFFCNSSSCAFCEKERPVDKPYLSVDDWRSWCPPGSFVVFDEAQHCFRPQPAGTPVPDHITFFETHRHHGIDGLLITQHPKLLHSNVRRLVGKHVHIVRTFAGSFKYEWPETSDTLSYAQAVKTPFKKNTKVYHLYKSAEIHNAFKLKMHPAVYMVLAAIPAVLYFAYGSYKTLTAPPQLVFEQVPLDPVQFEALPGSDTDVVRGAGGQDSTVPGTMSDALNHPFAGFDLYLTGVSNIGGFIRASFVGRSPGFQDYTIGHNFLVSSGYHVQQLGPCTVNLYYNAELLGQFGCMLPPIIFEEEPNKA